MEHLTEPFFAELLVKIGSLNLFNTESTFRYRKMLKFWGLKYIISLMPTQQILDSGPFLLR